MKHLLIFVISLYSCLGFSQKPFHNTYNLNPGQNESGTEFHFLSDGILLIGTGSCQDEPCTFITKVDHNGELLWKKEYQELVGIHRRTAVHDSVLYLVGDKVKPGISQEQDGFRLYRFDLYGEEIDSKKYNLDEIENPSVDSIRRYLPQGSIIYNDKVVVYGQMYETQSDESPVFSRGLLVWYNMDLSLDTMIIIQPRYEEVEIWDAKIDADGNLAFLIDDDIITNEGQLHYRRFEKYNGKAEKVFSSPPFLLARSNSIRLASAQLDNGDQVMYYSNDSVNIRSYELVSMDLNGDINWIERIDPNLDIDERTPSMVFQSSDGNILLAGGYFDGSEKKQGAFISKYNSINGEFIWERVFQDWTNYDPQDRYSYPSDDFIVDILEDASDNLYLIGNRTKYHQNFERDILLIKTDSEGCIQEGCGGFEQNVAGEAKYYPMLYEGSIWYYQDREARDGIYQVVVNGYADNIYSFHKRDWRLDPKDIFGGFGSAHHIFRASENGPQIFLVKELDTMLLYDFSLELGDTFESPYCAYPLEVIDSDTIVLINGAKKRTWTLSCSENPENTLRWIEGVGTDYGILWPKDFCTGEYGKVRLTCYYEYERLQYINEGIGGCFLSDVEDTAISSASVSIAYPNPVHELLLVDQRLYSAETNYSILRVDGSSVIDNHKLENETIDVHALEAGIYFLQLISGEDRWIQKFVKL